MADPSDKAEGIDRRTLLRAAAGVATSGLVAGVAAPKALARSVPLPVVPVDLAGTAARWGGPRLAATGDAIEFPHGAHALFPKVARLPVAFPRDARDWSVSASIESSLKDDAKAPRRGIEDVALSVADGRVQLWLGGVRTPGARLLVYGRTVATAAVFLPPPGETARLELAVSGGGHLDASVNGTRLASQERLFADPSLRAGGPIDLVSRNGPVRWSDIVGAGLADEPISGAPWQRRPGEPAWDPREAIGYGYQPLDTHLWSRWTGQLLPTVNDYAALRALGGGDSLVTHGPLFGMPAAGRLGVMVRTARPTTAWLVGGPDDDPAAWRPLAEFATNAARGNTGHAEVGVEAFGDGVDALNITVETDGALADLREDGAWPILRRRWLTADSRDAARIAVTHCDNFYPAVAALHSPRWRTRTADADLALHLGDHVYEQGFRRRAEVSRLDHLHHFAPGMAQAWRGRWLPSVGLFDDHDLYNDIAATGETGRFTDLMAQDGYALAADLPWRVGSRDTGRAVWEEWVGWGTPQDGPHAVITGSGTVVGGVLRPDTMAPWEPLTSEQIAALAPLVISPNSVPRPPYDIAPYCAGAYRIVGVEIGRGIVRLDPAPVGRAEIRYGVSTPRYGSVRIGNAELLLIDVRTMRTLWRLDRADPAASMLGPVQRAWLLNRIRKSTAEVLLIASSNTVSFANEAGEGARAKRDSWTAYEYERGLILDALARRDGSALFLTGDLHNQAVRRLAPNIWEVICGAWSNIGFCDIAGAARPVEGYPGAELLWAGPATSPDCDWASGATIVETERGGGVSLEFIDTAADRTINAMRLGVA